MTAFDNAGATNGGFPYSAPPLATTVLEFDPQTGRLADNAELVIDVPRGSSLVLDLSRTTQLAADFSVSGANVDGSRASAATGYTISDDGTIYARYASGELSPLYQLALATVSSPDNLDVLSGNTYQTTGSSGVVTLGYAGMQGFGTIVSGAIETSNVDIANELTEMIEAQRSYSANSKVFQTGSDLMDVLINMAR